MGATCPCNLRCISRGGCARGTPYTSPRPRRCAHQSAVPGAGHASRLGCTFRIVWSRPRRYCCGEMQHARLKTRRASIKIGAVMSFSMSLLRLPAPVTTARLLGDIMMWAGFIATPVESCSGGNGSIGLIGAKAMPPMGDTTCILFVSDDCSAGSHLRPPLRSNMITEPNQSD